MTSHSPVAAQWHCRQVQNYRLQHISIGIIKEIVLILLHCRDSTFQKDKVNTWKAKCFYSTFSRIVFIERHNQCYNASKFPDLEKCIVHPFGVSLHGTTISSLSRRTVTHVEDTDDGVTLERQDLSVYGKTGQCRCWCAGNKNTLSSGTYTLHPASARRACPHPTASFSSVVNASNWRIPCCVVNVWKVISGKS